MPFKDPARRRAWERESKRRRRAAMSDAERERIREYDRKRKAARSTSVPNAMTAERSATPVAADRPARPARTAANRRDVCSSSEVVPPNPPGIGPHGSGAVNRRPAGGQSAARRHP